MATATLSRRRDNALVELTKIVLQIATEEDVQDVCSSIRHVIREASVTADVRRRLTIDYAGSESETKRKCNQLANIYVIDAEPVDRGLLALKTQVIFIQRDTPPDEEVESVVSYRAASRDRLSSLQRNHLKPKRIFGFEKSLKKYLASIQMGADDFHCVGVCKRTMDRLQIREKEWIVISMTIEGYDDDNDDDTKGKKRLSSEYRQEAFLRPGNDLTRSVENEEYEEVVSVNLTEEAMRATTPRTDFGAAVARASGSNKHFVQVFCFDKDFSAEKTTRSASTSSVDSVRSSFPSSDSVDDSSIYISPYLYFNLTIDFPAIEDHFEVKVEKVSDVVRRVGGGTPVDAPPHAKEVHLMRVNSPNSKAVLSQENFDAYFSEPRLLSENDVFCIPFEERKTIYADSQYCTKSLVFFKVQSMSPHTLRLGFTTYFVDKKFTSVIQDKNSIPSYVPLLLDSFLCSPEYPNWKCTQPTDIWHDPMPRGLQRAVSKLKYIILPSLVNFSDDCPIHTRILMTGPIGVGMATAIMAASRALNMHSIQANCYEYCCDTPAATETKLKRLFVDAISSAPCILILGHIEVLGKDRAGFNEEPRIATVLEELFLETEKYTRWPIVVIGCSSHPSSLSPDIHSLFLHEVIMEAPNLDERHALLEDLVRNLALHQDVSLTHLAHRTAGLVLGDLCALTAHATKAAYNRIVKDSAPSFEEKTKSAAGLWSRQIQKQIRDSGVSIRSSDCDEALAAIQSAHSDAIGAPKIPNVSWTDVGGLKDAKREIIDTIQLPLLHPDWFARGLRRSGVLLYGPPGCGKTLLAKAVASECGLNFLSVKGPELLNMYVGQSEENVREVFIRARNAHPCVIFFDELDSLAPSRGKSGDSGGVMDRVVSQLLTELDGLDKAQEVFVIGATNRPDLLDAALLRPGRFDRLVYLGVPKSHEARVGVFKALTRNFSFEAEFNADAFVDDCPGHLTGADFYAISSDAMLNAMKRQIGRIDEARDEGRSVSVSDDDVVVLEKDLRDALVNLQPSVTEDDLQKYQEMRDRMTSGKRY